MARIPIYQVDAFTDHLFGGNPAAVCVLDKWLEPQVMQRIAAENNLAETAFVVTKGKTFEIRWFTPKIEIDLCGHATLASAHVFFNHLDFEGDTIVFNSHKSGELKVHKSGGLLTLDFPANPPVPCEIPGKLAEALGMQCSATYKARDLLGLFDNEEQLVSMNPNFSLLNDVLVKIGCMGMIVTAPGKQSAFVSRFFAPPAGIDEDPVTGSAHTILIPFWAKRLDKTRMHAFQLSQRRGELFCELSGNRVLIGGKAVTYLKGDIYI